MKRVKKSATPPERLQNFVAARPNATWDQFRNSNARYRAVASHIRDDQRGLCAYCEINLLENTTPHTLPDFRIEHFHPKSPHSPPPNWSLEWTNLLGACHGGSQRDVEDPSRFTAPDVCCDVPKADNDWTSDILNPLSDIPAFPRLFKYAESSGEINVDATLCPSTLTIKAQGTIDRLKLNAPRLTRMREDVISGLRDQIEQLIGSGLGADEAAAQLSEAMFPDHAGGGWQAFFTCVRWYLGPAAEDRLTALGYTG